VSKRAVEEPDQTQHRAQHHYHKQRNRMRRAIFFFIEKHICNFWAKLKQNIVQPQNFASQQF
jgi:hypothetical protein